MLDNILLWIQISSAIAVIILVVMQPAKGSDLGSLAGGTDSSSSRSYIDPLTKVTALLVVIFILSSFFITYFDNKNQTESIFKNDSTIKIESLNNSGETIND